LTGLTAGFDEPVLSFVEGLRTNGWDIEGCVHTANADAVARGNHATLEGPPDGISRR
jgi:hypothetical protein